MQRMSTKKGAQMNDDDRRPFGLCMYGVLWAVGRIAPTTSLANPSPIDAYGLLELADHYRLAGVEVAPSFVSPELDEAALSAYRSRADELGLRITVTGPQPIHVDEFRRHIEACRILGSPVLRCTMSGLLEGNREPIGGYDGWRRHVADVIAALKCLQPDLQAAGVTVAVENHQDADSETLLEICRTVGSNVGVTFDTGNPLAVGEDPVAFAGRVAPYIADVHLKDYRLITTGEGYRLVHVAIGDGVVDFAAILNVLADLPHVPPSIEMASWNARHIRLLTDGWWSGYGPRDVRSLLPVLRLQQRKGETELDPGEWRTPLELGDTSDAGEWERLRLERSIENLDRVAAATQEA